MKLKQILRDFLTYLTLLIGKIWLCQTHNQGHTLDLCISKGIDITSVDAKNLALYDHCCAFFHLQITPHVTFKSASVNINEATGAKCIKAVAVSPIS